MKRLALMLLALCAIALCFVRGAMADTQTIAQGGGTYYGTDVVVHSGEVVKGDVTVFGGNATIDGEVDGDVSVFGGNVHRGPGSVVTGDVTDFPSSIGAYVPWTPGAAAAGIAAENAKLMLRFAYSALVLLIFLIFPMRVRLALDRMEQHPGLSAAVGAIVMVAMVPLAILLFITFIGWPLIPLEFVAIVAATLIGQAALAVLVGRRLYEVMFHHRTPSPIGALVLGLVVVTAAEMVPVLGWLVSALVWLVGLGAATMAFFGSRSAGWGVFGAAGGARPTIGGPPMGV